MKLYPLIMILSFAACAGSSEPEAGRSDPAPEETGTLTYLALGDSYTIGQSVSTDECWPVLLSGELKKVGKAVRAPDIIAATGWTTRNLLDALEQRHPFGQYDLVSLLIGVNNQYQGRNIEEYRAELRDLLDHCIIYAGRETGRVFVLSIPDWGVTPYGAGNREQITKEINRFNTVAEEECAKKKIRFLDITSISREALNDPSMIAADQLHFSGKMYQRWVTAILPQVKSLLK